MLLKSLLIHLLIMVSWFTMPDTKLSSNEWITDPEQVQKAKEHIEREEYSQALRIYIELWEQEPENYDFRLMVGLIKGWMGQYNESERHLRAMLRDYPENVEVGTALVRVLSWQHKYDSAISVGEDLLEFHPENEDLLSAVAHTYYWGGDYARSLNLAERVVELNSDNDIVNRLVRDIYVMNAPSITVGTILPRDSEGTRLNMFYLRGVAAIRPATRLGLTFEYFDTFNDKIGDFTDRKAWSIGANLTHTISHKFRLRGDIGITGYPSTNSTENDHRVTGGLDVRYNTGKHTLHTNYSRYTINESPFLIDRHLMLDQFMLVYRYRHRKLTLFAEPSYAHFSDGNNRYSVLISSLYEIDWDRSFYRPIIRFRHTRFQDTVLDMGYFSPENMTIATIGLNTEFRSGDGNRILLVNANTGFQKISHPALSGDPMLVYDIDARISQQAGRDFRIEAGYLYSNSQAESLVSGSDSYWYRALRLSIRYQFTDRD